MSEESPQVCFLSFCPSPGGIRTYQAHSISYLLERGVAVSLVDEEPCGTLERMARQRHSVRVVKAPLWTNRREASICLGSILKHRQPDVIAVSNYALLIKYAARLRSVRREHGTRIVVTVHSGVLTMTPRRRVLELAGACALGIADDVVYVSDYSRRYWEGKYPWMRRYPGRVVHNGVPTVEARSRRTRQHLNVAFVGRVEAEKGAELFCRIAREAQVLRHDVAFHVLGDGMDRGRLQGEFGDLISWHGSVSVTPETFAEIDLLLITSPVENCPYAVLEAKAAGVPTVAPAVGGLPEIIQDGVDGILVADRTTGAFLKGMDKAITTLATLRTGCSSNSFRFDMRRCGDRTWGRYIGERRRGDAVQGIQVGHEVAK